jgi:hypothetical protein
MNTKSIAKRVVTVFGASVVLAAGVAHAADNTTPDNQLKHADVNVQVAASKSVPVATTSTLAAGTTEKVREPVDVNSPSFRKFLDDVAQRSGG